MPAGPLPVLDVRRRGAGYLFVAVVVAHLVLISAQVTTRRGTPVLQSVAFGLVSGVQRGGAGLVKSIENVWTGYIDLRGLREQNAQLQRELADTSVRLQQERALAQQTRSLKALLELHERAVVQTTAAEVLANGATPDFRTVTINKGSTDGLKTDMAVLAPAGVVGRVIVPSRHAAKVQLLIDRNAAAGALVERSRAQAIVSGAGDDRLRLEYLSGSADVKVGDRIVTSGIDGIYPKGFLIGWVEKAERAGGSYSEVLVKPAVDFASLEDVLVALSPTETAQAAAEQAQMQQAQQAAQQASQGTRR